MLCVSVCRTDQRGASEEGLVPTWSVGTRTFSGLERQCLGVIGCLLDDHFPQIFRLRQTFDSTRVEDVPAEVQTQLARLELGKIVRPGQSVAVTAGSRGIANVAVITKAIVEHLAGFGEKPFVVPAMGSHGGGSAEGQRRLVESYGVTERSSAAPSDRAPKPSSSLGRRRVSNSF